MRAQIFLCLTELIKKKFGKEKLDEILAASGLSDSKSYMRHFNGFDFSDEKFIELVKNLCTTLNLTQEQAAEAFGQYWVCNYAFRLYPKYYKDVKNVEDFLMKLDTIHMDVTANSPKNVEAAHPPRFDITRVDEKTLHIHYKSKRRMIDFYIGLVKGVGHYFNTPIEIQKLSDEELNVRWGT
jgi:hypothetical protein